MKKRRTRKQKIGAKRQPVRLAAPSPVTTPPPPTIITAPLTSFGGKEEAGRVDRSALGAIKFDLAKTVLLSLLIFGLEISIYFWWN